MFSIADARYQGIMDCPGHFKWTALAIHQYTAQNYHAMKTLERKGALSWAIFIESRMLRLTRIFRQFIEINDT